ncbi:MAG: FAD-dependent oxidoreductase [Gemmatimonadetes bacterium]|nr:FAD-dependent oxidoreductase [Gemmatimonadota bacterium]
MSKDTPPSSISRRDFVRTGATAGLGATALAVAKDPVAAESQQQAWDMTADVVIAGAGVSGLSAAVEARDRGASVIIVEQNSDCGGHGIVSGGRVNLGGGTSRQRRQGVEDSADAVFEYWIRPDDLESRFTDRDLTRVFADLSAETFEWMVANGVRFEDEVAGEDSRNGRTLQWPVYEELITSEPTRRGSGLVRALEKSARAKGAQILLQHSMAELVQDPGSKRVLGLVATTQGRRVRIRATGGVILATGGHTSNVQFRRMFDPRLTEEYQVAGEPYSKQTADGEIAAMKLGAAVWGTASQSMEAGNWISKTAHIGCQWGYSSLHWQPDSPIFDKIRASGLTNVNWQNCILVKQTGVRFHNEMDGGHDFFAACFAWSGDPNKLNGGGPIWAIFDADAVARQEWDPRPPNVDPDGWFFSADTLSELAGRIRNPYQTLRMQGSTLQQTVSRYNSFVDSGTDGDFGKPTPQYKIQRPPFYAAWSTPILHDTLCGLRVDTRCRVIDLQGQAIAGLYCCGEAMGGFPQHGLGRCSLFGRVAARSAAASA